MWKNNCSEQCKMMSRLNEYFSEIKEITPECLETNISCEVAIMTSDSCSEINFYREIYM